MDRLAGLQLFVRIVESGSFSQAARELGITQPTATKHIAALEAQFGARLLNRNSRSLSLTELGARYYERCKNVLHEYAEVESLSMPHQAGVRGTLRVGMSLTFGRVVVLPLLLDFLRANPQFEMEVVFDDRYVDMVAQGIDLAIRLGRLEDSSLGGRLLGVSPWTMVAAPDYLQAHGTPISHEDLVRHVCLVYTSVQGDERWQLRTPSGRPVTVPVQGPLRTNSLMGLLDAAHAGMGIVTVPYCVAAEAIAAERLRVVLPDYRLPDQEIHVVYPSPRRVPAPVQALVAWLQERFPPRWWMARR